MPAIKLGNHPVIVYTYRTNDAAYIRRYDVLTRVKTNIVSITLTPQNSFDVFSSPSVSSDGQWITFLSAVNGRSALQMVRSDGQYLQTLYCSASNRRLAVALLSPDQRHLAFSEYERVLYLSSLGLKTGKLQAELNPLPGTGIGFDPVKWLDNKSLLVTGAGVGVGGGGGCVRNRIGIYLLRDITKDASQQRSNLLPILDTSPTPCLDFDLSQDATQLILSNFTVAGTTGPVFTGPSYIKARSLKGSSTRTIYQSDKLAIFGVRTISRNALLYVVFNSSNSKAGTSQNGLWTINTNGSGARRLLATGPDAGIFFDLLAYTPWSYVSRDGNRYVTLVSGVVNNTEQQTLYTGSLHGGQAVAFGSTSGNFSDIEIAGWTTYQ